MTDLAQTPSSSTRTPEIVVDVTTAGPSVELPQAQPLMHLRAMSDEWQPGDAFRYGGRRLKIKRATDKAVAGLAMVALAPVIGAIALAIKITSPRGPVFFRQERIGRYGEPFRIVKFRTMHVNAEEHLRQDRELWDAYVANDFKLEADNDPRVTRVGKWLRKTSLDELPQFINIWRGDMSVVGPRPVIREELEAYGPWVEAYLHVFPGLTGVWQVEGRNDVAYPERALLDVEYADRWTLRRDFSLAARTLPAVLTSNGVK